MSTIFIVLSLCSGSSCAAGSVCYPLGEGGEGRMGKHFIILAVSLSARNPETVFSADRIGNEACVATR